MQSTSSPSLSSPRSHRVRHSIDSLPSYSAYSSELYDPDDDLPRRSPDHPPDRPLNPDSADEADREDDGLESPLLRSSSRYRPSPFHTSPRPPPSSHRPLSPFYTSQSSAISDPNLDSLLERSVHALEMSNALLQSSNSHRQSKSIHTSPPFHYSQHRIQRRYRRDRPRLKKNFVHEPWMKELADLADSWDDLFGDNSRNPSDNGQGISSSLPSNTFHAPPLPKLLPDDSYVQDPPTEFPHRPSSHQANSCTLTDSYRPTNRLSYLPSNLRSRSGSLATRPSTPRKVQRRSYSHDFDNRPISSSGTSPIQAYLSHLFSGRLPAKATSPRSYDLNSSDGGRQGGRTRMAQKIPSRDSSLSRGSMSPIPSIEIRRMTPPQEEITPPSSESSPPASQALECLRKILQDAPPDLNKRPRHVPPRLISDSRSSPSAPQESNTTASITRLHTRGTHRSSTSAPPPKQSSLKPLSPMLSSGQLSPISSGRSTPRHKVQFAELPESYSSSRPGSKSKSAKKSSRSKQTESTGWWKTFWGIGDSSVSSGRGSRFEDRIEDRVARSWGRPPFGAGGLDEWSIQ